MAIDLKLIDKLLGRDRDASGSERQLQPKMVAKGQTRFTGFDDKILSMYARGMSTREITGHLEERFMEWRSVRHLSRMSPMR